MNGLACFVSTDDAPTAEAAPPINYSNYDYYVENMTVYMSVDSLGNLDVYEAMRFEFNRGIYSMAYREVPHEGFDEMKGAVVYNETGAALKSGFEYKFDMFRGIYEIRWPFTPKVSPGNASFTVNYQVTNAAKTVAKDQLGLDWNIIGKGWDVPIKILHFYAVLPKNVTDSPLFDYIPSDCKVEVKYNYFTGSEITYLNFTREHLRPNKAVRFVVYYPEDHEPVTNFETVLREYSLFTAAIIFLIFLLTWLAMAVYKNLAPKIPPKSLNPNGRITRDPSKLTALLKGRYGPMAMFAGIVNLAIMGFLRIIDDGPGTEVMVEAREDGPDELQVQLSYHDTLILNDMGEAPARKPLGDLWARLGQTAGDQMHRDLKLEGYFSRTSRTRLSLLNIGTGITMASICGLFLYLLIETYAFYAVIYGGILLGLALGGIAILVIGGFFMPRYTSRGASERSQQAAYLGRVIEEMEKRSRSDPHEVPPAFDRFGAALTAAPVSVRGGFPTMLRKISAQAGGAEYFHPWYEYSTIEGGPAMTFGAFGDAYAGTLERVPALTRGRRAPRKKGKALEPPPEDFIYESQPPGPDEGDLADAAGPGGEPGGGPSGPGPAPPPAPRRRKGPPAGRRGGGGGGGGGGPPQTRGRGRRKAG